jgi:DNA-binding NarL/FixJ family response regulator
LKEKARSVDFHEQRGAANGYNSERPIPGANRTRATSQVSLAAMKELPVCPHAQIRREEIFGNNEIRCLLAHDHVLLRQGLRRLLEDKPDIKVIAEAGNAAEALHQVFEQRPDVVITDAQIFACATDQTEWLILQQSPQTRVLFLSMHESGDRLGEVRADGTSCAARQTCAEELVEMVRRVHTSQRRVVREIPERRRGEWLPEELHARKRVLTAREHEVLKLLAEGRTVRSAASVLGLSVKTVDAHKFNLMRKLGIHNKAELVMWAIQKRVVKLPVNF